MTDETKAMEAVIEAEDRAIGRCADAAGAIADGHYDYAMLRLKDAIESVQFLIQQEGDK